MNEKRIILIEVKHMDGELHYDDSSHQLLQVKDGCKKAYPDPLLQVKRQAHQLEKWIKTHSLPYIPIEPFVVFTHPSAILSSSHLRVFPSDYLPFQLNTIADGSGDAVWTNNEQRSIMNLCYQNHTPYVYDVLQKFQLKAEDLMKGVLCERCISLPMEKVYGGWKCPRCESFSNNAHVKALNDYYLLFGDSISNAELREFLRLPSRNTVRKLMNDLKITPIGTKRNAKWDLKSKFTQ
ncbi:nuclease-related domain-containing protein [Halobacillus yeomjeoni]|uniref:NERD domain-containing protein n=1 Tax=Halobacillus yeomjeoni TaxID=311194 RepID=A0A931MVF5_9BACI|nr:nuclease-related domain-containing protein [Halobacillus yeomjeoni]MBH0230983.1 NERD domain-containing protein [Halobacillus yeomjeoni]